MAIADVRIVDPESGDIADFLPDWDSLSFSSDSDGTGALSFDYPRSGRHRDDMLESGVLAVLIDGEEPRNLRFVRSSRDSNRVGDSRLTDSLSFVALPQALQHAQFVQKGGTDPEKPVDEEWETRSWTDSTPGRVYAELLEQAAGRGVLDWWGYQGHDFTDGEDSDGDSWDDRNTREHKYNQDVWTIVQQMVGDRQLKVGSDRGVLQARNWDHGSTRDDVVLWAGRDLLDAPEQSTWDDYVTDLYVVGTLEEDDDDAESGTRKFVKRVHLEVDDKPYGRFESVLKVDNVRDEKTLKKIGRKYLGVFADGPRTSRTYELASQASRDWQPFTNFMVDDTVWVNLDGGWMRDTVKTISADFDSRRQGTFKVTCNDWILDRGEEWIEDKIKQLERERKPE